MFKHKYRIVRDDYAGYEAQVKLWYWPFWMQMGFSNTHRSIKEAEEFIQTGGIVKYVEKAKP